MNTHRGWLVNRLFASMMSQAYQDLLVNRLFGLHYVAGTLVVSLQSSIYILSCILIGSVMSIAYLSPLCHEYSLRVPCHCLFVSIMSQVLISSVFPIVCLSPLRHAYSFWGVLSIIYLSLCRHWYIGISYQSYIYLHCVMGTR